MESKRIQNTSKGFLKKIFGKDDVDALVVTEKGFRVVMDKSGEQVIPYEEVLAAKANFYLEPAPAYKTLSVVTKDNREYSLNIAPHSGEIEYALKQFAHFQLKGELPEKIEDIDLMLQYMSPDYSYKLQDGKLVEVKKGIKTQYPWRELEYYRIDRPSNLIQLKFKEKKLFVSLIMHHVTNLYLVLEILQRFAKKA